MQCGGGGKLLPDFEWLHQTSVKVKKPSIIFEITYLKRWVLSSYIGECP